MVSVTLDFPRCPTRARPRGGGTVGKLLVEAKVQIWLTRAQWLEPEGSCCGNLTLLVHYCLGRDVHSLIVQVKEILGTRLLSQQLGDGGPIISVL